MIYGICRSTKVLLRRNYSVEIYLKNDLNARRLQLGTAVKGMVVRKAEVCHCSSIMFDSVVELPSLISFIFLIPLHLASANIISSKESSYHDRRIKDLRIFFVAVLTSRW